MTRSCIAAILASLTLAVGLPGCTSNTPKPAGGTQEKIKVAFVSNNPHQFCTIAEAGTKKAAEEFGVEVFFRRPPNSTASEQKDIIEDLLTKKVQGIAVSVNDPVNQKDFLNKIADR